MTKQIKEPEKVELPSKPELLVLYWGEDGYPDQWHEPEQISEEADLDIDIVKELLVKYEIELRTEFHHAHKAVWDIFDQEYNMVNGTDFDYRTKVNGRDVDFFLIDEVIGIILKEKGNPLVVDSMWMGETCISIFSIGDLEVLTQSVRDFLKTYGVTKKFENIRIGEEDVW